MRVHELAKSLGITAKEVLTQCKDLGIEAKNPMSDIDERGLALLRGETPPPAPAPEAPPPETPEVASDEADSPPPPPKKMKAPKAEAPAAKKKDPAPKPPPTAPREPQTVQAPPPSAKTASARHAVVEVGENGEKVLRLRGSIIVKDLAELLDEKPNMVIAQLMRMNILAAINQRIDANVAKTVAEHFGFRVEERKGHEHQETLTRKDVEKEEAEDKDVDLIDRAPVVTFLGHVDHGKTSLLDRIRDTRVAAGESGGITQHIGAYTVEAGGKPITFLDTPGHAAFTAMRARGANMTDIAVIIIAADDGIMPQTREAIQHVKAANVALMVAINKIDLPTANVDRVLQQLQAENLAPEDWGGDTICCPVSAETGEGMDHLLEMILLQAEMLELKANPSRRAEGYVIEAQLEPGRGPTVTALVTRGTLSVGNIVLCGQHCGKVRALINDHGAKIKSAGPSTPVKLLGLPGVPGAGDQFRVFANEKAARAIATEEAERQRNESLFAPKKASLDSLFDQIEQDGKIELRAVLKADTQGSVEAIIGSLNDIPSDKISLNIILSGTGNITENDVMLASASNAIVLGFHVGRENTVNSTAKHEGVEIHVHSVIYELIDQVREAMTGLLMPVTEENVRGRAEIRQVFTVGRGSRIAGCLVVSGNIRPSYRARVRHNGEVMCEGRIEQLKHFQDDVNEVRESQECGIRLDKTMQFNEGDILEFYELTEVAQSL